jgi:hypothetical protein
MFKLRVSKTLLSLSIAFLLSGPGISVWIIGAAGSSGKNGCSLVSGIAAAAAAEAYRLRNATGATLTALGALELMSAGRKRPAVRRSEAIVGFLRGRKDDVGYQREVAIARGASKCGDLCRLEHHNFSCPILLKGERTRVG